MGSDRLIHVVRVFLNQRHSVFTRGPCLIKSAPQCSLCHASVSWSVLGAVVVLKARQSWVKLKSWLIPSSTTPRGYYFHPFPDNRAEGAKYRFSGFTPNKQTNKQTLSLSYSRSRSCLLAHSLLPSRSLALLCPLAYSLSLSLSP